MTRQIDILLAIGLLDQRQHRACSAWRDHWDATQEVLHKDRLGARWQVAAAVIIHEQGIADLEVERPLAQFEAAVAVLERVAEAGAD